MIENPGDWDTALDQNFDRDGNAPIVAAEQSANGWNPAVEAPFITMLQSTRRKDSDVEIIGDLESVKAGSLRQSSFGQSFETPGQLSHQRLAVLGARLFAEQFPVLVTHFGDRAVPYASISLNPPASMASSPFGADLSGPPLT
jgi:hypothetical protein